MIASKNKHLTKGCPLPIEIIANQRQTFKGQAKMFYWLDHKEKRKVVTARTILFMDKFRNQDLLENYLNEMENE